MSRPTGAGAWCVLAVATVLLASTGAVAATRALSITNASALPEVPFKGFDGNPPKAFDIDGDGDQEILAQNDNHYLYVFDSKTGKLLAQLKATIPAGWTARTFNGPEAYREDGVTRIIQQSSAAVVTSWRYDAAASTATSFKFVKEWERRLSDCFSNPGADSKPVLADLDRDGKLDILVSTEESGIYAIRSDGTLAWKKCIGGGNGEPRAADLNQDGWLDVVFASDAGIITAMAGRCAGTLPCTPATIWSFSILSRYDLGSGSVPVGPGIGQLDGVGGPDIVVGARDSHNATDWSQDHALLLALSSTGQVLWARQDPQGSPLTYTHPVVADADRNGVNEVYWADWNTVGHKPPEPDSPDAWKLQGPACADRPEGGCATFYRYDNRGNLVWRTSLGTFWNNKDLAIADADGDGQQEVLATGPSNEREGIWLLNAATGAKEAGSFIDAYPWLVSRGPVLGDLWGTGGTQMILEVGPQATTEGAAVHVYDLGVPFNAVYPSLPPSPGVTPPPPPGSAFSATYSVKAPNEWWQEMYVDAPGHTITSADIRINSGAWQPLTKSSWGAWTGSYNTKAGAKVEFFVRDSDGLLSQSLPFTWMDGTLTRGSTTPTGPTTSSTSTSTTATTTSSTTTSTGPTSTTSTTTAPPPGFSATFQVPSGANEWWVEVKVTASQTVTKVEVSRNDGAWADLPKTSWGTWAKSLHTPAGTKVVFRATSADNSVAVSPAFSWLQGSSTTTSTTTSSTSSTGGVLTASFSPRAVGNDWWVEAAVTASKPLATVEASLNGGAWQSLPPTDWGTWAKSINAPNGTQVVFRATATDGSTATSSAFTWT